MSGFGCPPLGDRAAVPGASVGGRLRPSNHLGKVARRLEAGPSLGWRSSRWVAAVGLLASFMAAPDPTCGIEGASLSLSLPALNRAYADVVPELDPIHSGPLTIYPSVPHSTLEIHHHRLDLKPVSPGVFDALLDITIAGRGILAAKIVVIGPSTSLRDEVILPAQTLRIPSRVRLAWATNGLAVTALTLPSALDLRVESTIGGRLVGSCEAMGSLIPIGCDGLAHTLSRLRVPLGEPGTTYLIPMALIDDESIATLRSTLETDDS